MAEHIILNLLAGGAILALLLTISILKTPVIGFFEIDISIGIRGISIKVKRNGKYKKSKRRKR